MVINNKRALIKINNINETQPGKGWYNDVLTQTHRLPPGPVLGFYSCPREGVSPSWADQGSWSMPGLCAAQGWAARSCPVPTLPAPRALAEAWSPGWAGPLCRALWMKPWLHSLIGLELADRQPVAIESQSRRGWTS